MNWTYIDAIPAFDSKLCFHFQLNRMETIVQLSCDFDVFSLFYKDFDNEQVVAA